MPAPYLLGRPRIAARVLLRELAGSIPVYGFFIGGPLLAVALLRASPAPRPWERIGAGALAVVAAVALLSLAVDVLTGFGLRLVPRFDRRLEPDPGTYFGGRTLLRQVGKLDEAASAAGVLRLVDLGAGEPDDRGRDLWFASGAGRDALAAHAENARRLGLGPRVVTDIERIVEALAAADATGARFRLVVVAGTAMNARSWDHLRRSGF